MSCVVKTRTTVYCSTYLDVLGLLGQQGLNDALVLVPKVEARRAVDGPLLQPGRPLQPALDQVGQGRLGLGLLQLVHRVQGGVGLVVLERVVEPLGVRAVLRALTGGNKSLQIQNKLDDGCNVLSRNFMS